MVGGRIVALLGAVVFGVLLVVVATPSDESGVIGEVATLLRTSYGLRQDRETLQEIGAATGIATFLFVAATVALHLYDRRSRQG